MKKSGIFGRHFCLRIAVGALAFALANASLAEAAARQSKPDARPLARADIGKTFGNWLIVPVRIGAPLSRLKISNAANLDEVFYDDFEYIDSENPDFYAGVYLKCAASAKDILVQTQSGSNETFKRADKIPYPKNFPNEKFRPKFNFTPATGYVNDPNGLVYWKGKWHLFFQHEPTKVRPDFQRKNWGHAVSSDLMNWTQLPPAFVSGARRSIGQAYSGTAYADADNKSGFFGKDGGVVFAFTREGIGDFLAYSSDMENFTELSECPIVLSKDAYGRDPRIFWYEPSKHWVVVRYELSAQDSKTKTFAFYISKDLKNWKRVSKIDGMYECPDFREMKVQGSDEKKWILTEANGAYYVGDFDGKVFTPLSQKLPCVLQGKSYAAQLWQNVPDGRTLVSTWAQSYLPENLKMPFNHSISFPIELKLHRDGGGNYGLKAFPAAEFFSVLGKPSDLSNSAAATAESANADSKSASCVRKLLCKYFAPAVFEADFNLDSDDSKIILEFGKIKFVCENLWGTVEVVRGDGNLKYNCFAPKSRKLEILAVVDNCMLTLFFNKNAVFCDFISAEKERPLEVKTSGARIESLNVRRAKN